jgi:hypothetical protein
MPANTRSWQSEYPCKPTPHAKPAPVPLMSEADLVNPLLRVADVIDPRAPFFATSSHNRSAG